MNDFRSTLPGNPPHPSSSCKNPPPETGKDTSLPKKLPSSKTEKIYLLPRSHHLPRQERVFLSRSLHLCQVRIGVLESTFLFRDEPFQRYFLHLPGTPPDSSSSCKNPPPETGKDSLPPKMLFSSFYDIVQHPCHQCQLHAQA